MRLQLPRKDQFIVFVLMQIFFLTISFLVNETSVLSCLISLDVIIIFQSLILNNLRGFKYKRIILRLLIYFMYLIQFSHLGLSSKINASIQVSSGVLIGLFILVMIIIINLKDIRFGVSDILISNLQPLNHEGYIAELMSFFIIPILEEIYFRLFIFEVLKAASNVLLALLVVGLSLPIHHYLSPWSKNSRGFLDFANLFFFSIGVTLIWFFSGSLILCITAHLLYNLPYFIRIQKLRRISVKTEITV